MPKRIAKIPHLVVRTARAIPIVVAALAVSNSALGQDAAICHVVLQNASVTSSTFSASDVSYFLAKEVCSQNFNTYQKFSSWAAGANVTVPFAEGLLGLGGTARNNDGVFRSEYQAACNKLVQSGQQAYTSSQFLNIYSAQAYEAWEACISAFAKAQGAFAAVVMQGSAATDFSVRLQFTGQVQFPVAVQSITPGESLLQCTYGGQPVKAGLQFANEYVVSFDCKKTPESDLSVDINTTAGSVTAVRLPAKQVPPGVDEKLAALERHLQAQITALEARAVPSQTVIAYAGQKCPEGWVPYTQLAGRVAVGSGTDDWGNKRVANGTGGIPTVKLTVAQMPAHTHEFRYVHNAESGRYRNNVRPGDETDSPEKFKTLSAGGGQAHENMPPYLVMTMCEKA